MLRSVHMSRAHAIKQNFPWLARGHAGDDKCPPGLGSETSPCHSNFLVSFEYRRSIMAPSDNEQRLVCRLMLPI